MDIRKMDDEELLEEFSQADFAFMSTLIEGEPVGVSRVRHFVRLKELEDAKKAYHAEILRRLSYYHEGLDTDRDTTR
jgi:hypothetical protein